MLYRKFCWRALILIIAYPGVSGHENVLEWLRCSICMYLENRSNHSNFTMFWVLCPTSNSISEIMERRLAVDAAAVDNSNDSGRNWKLSIGSSITLLTGPGGTDKWEIWETTASCESKSDCHYCPFHSACAPFQPPHTPFTMIMQSYSNTYWLT